MTELQQARTRRDICPECESRLRRRQTEIVCEQCGLVQREDAIDRGPEWRSLEDGTDRRRTGAPLTATRHDRGLSTKIGFGVEVDTNTERRRKLVRMRRQHNRSLLATTAERNRRYACTEIRRIVAAMSLSASVCEQACSLFASAQSADLLPGRTIEGFAAASVYATCRSQGVARTIEEVLTVARANRDELTAAYDALNRELGLPVGPICPSEYIPRYATSLDLPTPVERRATEFVAMLAESGRLGGKNPSGVAAACLYRAALEEGVSVTQQEVADIANVSRMTVCSTASDIEEMRGGPSAEPDTTSGTPGACD